MPHHHNAESDPPPADRQAADKLALRKSQAGMRFIAQMHIYNSRNWERLGQFIAESYHEEMLTAQAPDERLSIFQAVADEIGRLKVKQVVGTSDHQAIVVMEAERTEHYYYVNIAVEDDYPHKITLFLFQQMQPAQ